jgi:cell division control protein 45
MSFYRLPLAQARQAYGSMDLELRKEFLSSLEKLSEKYSVPDIVFISFNLKYGYKNKFCATDVVYALLAVLEHVRFFTIETQFEHFNNFSFSGYRFVAR